MAQAGRRSGPGGGPGSDGVDHEVDPVSLGRSSPLLLLLALTAALGAVVVMVLGAGVVS